MSTSINSNLVKPRFPDADNFVEALRTASEDAGIRNVIETRRWLTITSILLRAAFESAEHGNVRMRQALTECWSILPKTATKLPHPSQWPEPPTPFKT